MAIFFISCAETIDNRKAIVIIKLESWSDNDWKYWASPIKGEPRMIYFLDDPHKYNKGDTIHFF